MLVFAAVLFLWAPAASGTEKPLTNDDVVAMARASLSDAAIIATINRSRAQFDLAPAALVKLRQAGVSNAVIEAMLGQGRASPAERRAPSEARSLDAGAGPVPTAYGYYVLDGGQLRVLEPVPVTTIIGLRPGGPRAGTPGWAVDGFKGEPPITLSALAPVFIVYQQNPDVSSFRFSALEFTSVMRAYQFNVHGTARPFFANVFEGMTPEDEIGINLWRAKGTRPLPVEPVEGKPGMFRLTVQSSLTPGRYGLWQGQALHEIGTVFATDGSRQASAFLLRVGGTGVDPVRWTGNCFRECSPHRLRGGYQDSAPRFDRRS
jgi:hypothetical protein